MLLYKNIIQMKIIFFLSYLYYMYIKCTMTDSLHHQNEKKNTNLYSQQLTKIYYKQSK